MPFDYADPTAGSIPVYFEWYPAVERARGTVLAVEGGPGYASTGSRNSYIDLLGPLHRTRNLLIVDLRGTGHSGVIDCKQLQKLTSASGRQTYIDAVGECGNQLDKTRKNLYGQYVRGSRLYTTGNAVRDVARLLDLLKLDGIDLYGDSYGTYFAQVFADEFPSKLRSVVLDSAYPIGGKDPFYLGSVQHARVAFDVVCERSSKCGGWSSIEKMVARVRNAPDGSPREDRIDTLIRLVLAAGSDGEVYRNLMPTVEEYLRTGNIGPFLRLRGAILGVGSEDSGPVKEFSAGLYVAVMCNDYPQPFMGGENRTDQYEEAVANLPENSFHPFTVSEWVNSSAAEFDSCLKWPQADSVKSSKVTESLHIPPSLPVLVLSGELDTLTTPEEGRQTASGIGVSAQWVEVSNSVHITALDDRFGCAEKIVRRFIEEPLVNLDASCAKQTPALQLPSVDHGSPS
ncbi:alpha/beta fold hydrolase [Streptomyces sp. 1222.5]|uniref:alpha/beta fold hydrolase n=1 Tax=Streptomyces sp. 1222.5 TaxID=1881026 RepID=UPI003EB6B7E9